MIILLCVSVGIISAQTSLRGMSKVIDPRSARRSFDRTWALIIGVDQYGNASPLKFAVNDSKAMRDVLVKNYGVNPKNLIELYDEDATKEKIIGSFERLVNETKPDDRVIIFYAGHGITTPLPENKERGYILPIDADPIRPITTAISTDQLSEMAEGMPAKHLYAIMDACYGGLIFARSQPISSETEDFIETVSIRRTRQALTAGGRDQPVFDTGPGGHSVFTFHLLEGLKNRSADLDKNGIITASELAAYIMPRVTTESHKQQTPQYGILIGDRGGEFVFVPQQKVSSLTVTSNVTGAAVYVNGDRAGLTPAEVDISEFGPTSVTVRADGYFDNSTSVNILSESESVSLDLQKASKLIINSNPEGAFVYMNDSLVGYTPLIIPKIQQSQYQLTLKKPDYNDYRTRIDLSQNDQMTVEHSLEKKKSSVSLVGAAGTADVTVKSSSNLYHFAGLPVREQSLDFDTYMVEINKPGYHSYSGSHTIRSDEFNVPIYLEPKSVTNSRIMSSIIPGAGQIYMDRPVSGWTMLGGSVIGAVLLVDALSQYQQHKDSYNTYNEKYNSARTLADLDKYYSLLSTENSAMQKTAY
ncbi:MAG: PEGA domain-containing protein, partial [Bacteroidota bacterium]